MIQEQMPGMRINNRVSLLQYTLLQLLGSVGQRCCVRSRLSRLRWFSIRLDVEVNEQHEEDDGVEADPVSKHERVIAVGVEEQLTRVN